MKRLQSSPLAILVGLSLMAIILATSTVVSLAAEVSQTVIVAYSGGAYVESENGAVHVQVPPYAASDSFKMRFTSNSGSVFSVRPTNAILLPNAFSVDFLNLDTDSDHISSLMNPGTITFKYNPSDLGGRSESTLKMMRLSDDGTTWNELATTVNIANHTVTAQFAWYGSYAVSASNVMPAPVPAPPAIPAPVSPPAPAAPSVALPAPAQAPAPIITTPPGFKLGFAALASLIPDVVGQPIEEEHYGSNGDSLQQTTKGLMVWRKADNWTAFTNGFTTWVNGPLGLQDRSNMVRFEWEK